MSKILYNKDGIVFEVINNERVLVMLSKEGINEFEVISSDSKTMKKSNFEFLLDEIKSNTNRLKSDIDNLDTIFKPVLRQLVVDNSYCEVQKQNTKIEVATNGELSMIELFLNNQIKDINYLINAITILKNRCCL